MIRSFFIFLSNQFFRNAQNIYLLEQLQVAYVMRCVIWYHSYNLKNVKNTHGGVLILVTLQALACNFTKSNTPLWGFFTFFKLYQRYQIAQSTTYCIKRHIASLEHCFSFNLLNAKVAIIYKQVN